MRNSTAFDDLLSRGLNASQAKDSARAIELFSQACAVSPASGVPYFLLGSELATVGDIDKAEEALANAVLLAPNFAIARYQLGLLQFSSGRAALSLVTWQPLLNATGTQPETLALACFVRGFATLAQDDFESALSHFQTGLTHNMSNQALTDDVCKVIERVQNLMAGTNVENAVDIAGGAKPGNNAAAVSDTSEDSHVLLRNYQNQRRSH